MGKFSLFPVVRNSDRQPSHSNVLRILGSPVWDSRLPKSGQIRPVAGATVPNYINGNWCAEVSYPTVASSLLRTLVSCLLRKCLRKPSAQPLVKFG